MSRSAAASPQPGRGIRRSASPSVVRRVSGPAYAPRVPGRVRPRLVPSPPVPRWGRPATGIAGGARAVAGGGAAIASRAAGLALDVSASPAMDRLVRSRAWIVILGFGLIGIVAMQVSMLKLNSGIGRAVDAGSTLQRGNAELRLQVSKLSAADRVQRLAADKGFVMPAPDDVGYLRAGDLATASRRAVQSMRPPLSGDAAPTPASAPPAVPMTDSAVLATAPGAAPKPSTTTPTPTPTSAPGATGGAAPSASAPTTAAAAPAAVANGATPASGASTGPHAQSPAATSSGGAAPPGAATATGP